MDLSNNRNYLLNWIEKQQSRGRYVFTRGQLRSDFEETSESAINLSLARLSKKGRIVSVYKGFYLIISPEYSTRGIIPPVQFIDDLMHFVGKPYYVGLLSAAALYGAAHQQPQEFYVVTNSKQTPTREEKLHINYVTKRNFPFDFIRKLQTKSGNVHVSSPLLTATDLIYFSNQVGGINRVSTVLNELADLLDPEEITVEFLESLSVPTIQKLGFILDKILFKNTLADKLYEEFNKTNRVMFRQPLTVTTALKGFPTDKKWLIIINTEIDYDE